MPTRPPDLDPVLLSQVRLGAVSVLGTQGPTSFADLKALLKVTQGNLGAHLARLEEAGYVAHLLSLCDRFAPGTSDLVVDTFALTPPKIEAHFGMTRGHIHHVDNAFGFADRLPYRTPIAGVYSCSAGTHPGGGVIGAAGHNAATAVLADLRGAG